ncbi:MAG: response regulator transcription factor [Calditrichaeota bacterium]|nr:response regulator transcription factor [Calditrichota bacterium]HQU73670.1 response regulator transcription factor [Calditrichia bacterium]
MPDITVSIVEDDPEIRESLALLINGTPGFTCESTYGSAEKAIKGLVEDLPDVVLMDIQLPGMTGIEAIKVLKEKEPDLDILVLTIQSDNKVVFEALCAGACGYLVKDTPPAQLLEAIQETHNGGAPMSTRIARLVVESFQITAQTDLTARETEVLTHLCKGKSYKMIADSLFISEETVRRHIKNIYRKLEVHSKSEAVAKAFKEKLVNL